MKHLALLAAMAVFLVYSPVCIAAREYSVILPAQPEISMAPEAPAPLIHPPFIEGIHPNTPFLWTISVTGQRPLVFAAKGLPKGLTINRATGTITGRIVQAGNYPVRVYVRNGFGLATHVVHLVAGSKLALTPPMGWNSYDAFGDSVTEAEVLANAEYVHTYLQSYGWDTVVVDFRWYDPGAYNNDPNSRAGAPLTMDAYGRLLPAPNRFPSAAGGNGFKALANKIHAMGLKFGIHIMRGIPRLAVEHNLPIQGSPYHADDAANTNDICSWSPDMYGIKGRSAAGQAYYDSLFRLYASWGVDFVKVDDMSRPYHRYEIDQVDRAIAKCGRSIVLSLSPGATPIAMAAHVSAHANMWRQADDFWDHWPLLNNEFALGQSWHSWAGPGHWPDADMLPIGHLSIDHRSVGRDRETYFTHDEQMTLISLWSLLPSPLIVGADLPDNDPWTLALLTNPEVLAIDQDSQGAAARCVSPQGDLEVWSKPLADGATAVGLFNRGLTAAPVTATWAELGLTGSYNVRDLWLAKNLGIFQNQFTMQIPPHGAALLKLTHTKVRR